ncbi:PQQ-binding-like beta-propeller repeat protein [Tundrisphaera sp. TA3]|uniref:outer membrane protein assembly factor BamB family protein n=1 Tax=Tundrisphaera sp. TA3 TaxID=3435775 RepID=UPI003EB9B227
MRRAKLALFGTVLGLLSGAARPAAADDPPGKPQVWGIVVGVDRYEDRLIPGCSTAVADSRAVADWIAGTAGWQRDHVLHLEDRGERAHGAPAQASPPLRPTRANLDWALTGWLAQRARPGDVAVIYFAGQAAVRPPLPGSPAGRGYLLPIDAAAANLDRTGWPLEDALDASGVAARARVVIWLDTSPGGRGKRGIDRPAGSPSASAWLNALARWPGVTAWMAGDAGRPSEETVPGPFVAALAKGLGGPSRAHNLVGCLRSLREDATLAGQGFLAAGGIDPALTLWPDGIRPVEAAVPELIVQNGHGDRVSSLIVTADGGHLISAGQDSTVRVWGLADRSLLRILTDPMNGVTALAMNPDGTALIAGDGMGRILGWDMTRDRPRSTFGPPEHADGIAALAFLPDGRRFVSLDRGGRSILWEIADGRIGKVRDFEPTPLGRIASADRPAPGAAAIVSAGEGGVVLAHAADGTLLRRFDPIRAHVTALGVSADGRKVAAGDDEGRVRVLDATTGAIEFDRPGRGPVSLVRFSPSGRLLVADAGSLSLVEPRDGGAVAVLRDANDIPAPGEIERAEFSSDGRWLAACTGVDGRVLAWHLPASGKAEPVAIEAGPSPGIAPAFGPDGRTLVVGDADGGIRSWTLDATPGRLRAEGLPPIRSARGKVASLRVSPDDGSILAITRDDIALVWDLKDRKGARPVPGSWVAGAFLPGGRALALAAHPDRGGDVVVFDRGEGKPRPIRFERPPGPDGNPSTAAFGSVAASRSGRWIAAATHDIQLPMACVWEAATGRLVHWTRIHDGGLTDVDFSGDEAYLLTASDDGTARVWPLADPAVELRQAAVVLQNPREDDPGITSARFSPKDPHRVVVGTRGGQVQLWDWAMERGLGRGTLAFEDRVEGSANAVAFSADGGWIVAAGERGKTIRFWTLPDGGAPRAVPFRPLPHHTEQVGALAPWSDGSRIVSGGDDTAVRVWDLAGRSLIGSLVATRRSADAFDWIAYTPDGLYDGSQPGEALVKWRVGGRVVTLEQAMDTHYAFGLAETFAQAERPAPKQALQESPRLKFVDPPAGRDPRAREVELTLWTGDRDLADLRLYQNGVPVRALGDFRVDPARPHFATTRVALRGGENRFYALASKPGATDGRSDDLAVSYDGAEPAGRLHTLALGISAYRSRALKYAHLDARRMASFLHERGVSAKGEPGELIVLTDDQVTEARVRDAFLRLSEAVKGHPEDTVVMFLAGHTDTDDRLDQFCLLLPEYPFGDPPATGVPIEVALRGNVRGEAAGGTGTTRVGDPNVLAFSAIYARLARLESLQRLVIVDACQAGAILNDPMVRKIQRLAETGSRKTRNSYLLAARRGEPATEADALQHGLLTYVLLKGMGADGLRTIPPELGGYPGPASADLDRDGVVSTSELARYTDETLPRLTQVFPQMVLRAGGASAPTGGLAPTAEQEKALRLQSAEAAFPLISIEGTPARP